MIIKEISRGISHIEDTPVMEFVKIINSLHEFGITEKLDGAQILFGIDENGFYTSRETKGGGRIYNEQDYGFGFSTTYMRSVHKLLEQVLPSLQNAGLKSGDQIESEVLYGELPNVVPYSNDTNYLIFIRATEGTVNIDQLKRSLDGQSLPITLLAPYTPDGKFIELREETNNWEFSQVPKISADIPTLQQKIRSRIHSLILYLKENSGINDRDNLTIGSLPLNKCPDWCKPQNWKSLKELIKEIREEINITVRELYIPNIKNMLLDHLVRNQQSKFGPLLEEGGWIEGVVLKHKVSGRMFKLVDKEVFGTVRENAWKERNLLTEAAKGIEGEHSFLAELYISLAQSIGHPELGTIQAKNYLRKTGIITEEHISDLSENINFDEVRNYWLNLLEQKEEQLLIRLNDYEKTKDSRNIHPAIIERVLQTFATTFEKIFILEEAAVQARKSEDLIMALIGKHLINS